MTKNEARKVIALVSAAFPGQIPAEPTGVLWATRLEGGGRSYADGVKGATLLMSTHAGRIYLANVLNAVNRERDTRRQLNASTKAYALPPWTKPMLELPMARELADKKQLGAGKPKIPPDFHRCARCEAHTNGALLCRSCTSEISEEI